jgi:hypothetical protein
LGGGEEVVLHVRGLLGEWLAGGPAGGVVRVAAVGARGGNVFEAGEKI